MNADAPQAFDPLQFPLRGWGLIEASAGTGKTWTIALLYLRLVLGHGAAEAAFPRPLMSPEILVMTFTEAATQELRERIRQRLTQAARVFAGESEPSDDALARLRAAYPAQDWPVHAAQLRWAADGMDDAAIHTLHAWAGRVLREHALASGSPFDEKIAPDDGPDVQQQALHDHWRRAFYPLDAAAARLVRACFAGPDALWQAVHPLLRLAGEAPLRYQGEVLEAADDKDNSLSYLKRDSERWLRAEDLQNTARRLWRKDRAQVEAIWREARPDLNGNSYRQKDDDTVFSSWLAALAAWSEGMEAPDNIDKFSASGVKLKKGKFLPEHAASIALDEWLAARDQAEAGLDALKARLIAQAARAVREETARIRAQRAELGFDDLLTRLDDALAGPGGEALAARVRAQFPVALVDEFQDTDPVQYRILQRIYGGAASDTALILIGDPKQAIYAFRGADIHTYLNARDDALAARGASASLDTNYRSTGELVAAVNHLFARAADRAQGAFGFRRDDGDPVPFAPVRAQGRKERLWIGGQPATALTLWNLWPDDGAACVSIRSYRERMATVFAAQVVHWLSHTAPDDPQRCGLVDAQGAWRPLRPGDIAVLVRSGAQADAIRAPLQQRGVQSVYLSERSSVFASQEARDVAAWLAALADPDDEVKLRMALATPTLDLPLSELERLAHDDLAWEEAARRWRDLRGRWQRQGALPMLHTLLGAHGLPARLLGQAGGERRLTNVLHLAEWLQARAGALDGPQALLRALQARIREPAEGGEENLLRLEGDGERLKVVTIHKSKGLEYPLVLLPFIAAWRDDARSAGPAVFHDEEARARVVELDGAQVRDRTRAQRMGEDMRLLYVALTRARHALWLGVAPLAARGDAKQPQLENGALGQILGQDAPIDSLDAYRQALLDTCAGQAGIALQDAPAPDGLHWQAPAPPTLQPARTFRHGGFAPWWIASYTALTRRMGALADDAPSPAAWSERFDAAAREADGDDAFLTAPDTPFDGAAAPLDDVRHAFARGADAGEVLHGLLQWCAQQGFGRVLADPDRLRDQAARRLAVRGWNHWVDPLCDWLCGFMDKPLKLSNEEQPLRLAGLEHALGEMEFWLPVRHLDVTRLDALVTAHIWPGEPRPPLAPGLLAGMVKGYIDLTFAHAGRYWVADYKSHRLGPNAAAYGPSALRAVMLAHRYDVQAVLYALALHRLLRARLPGYDASQPGQYLGGAAYCFLRGTGAEGSGVITLCPPPALLEKLDAALSEGAP